MSVATSKAATNTNIKTYTSPWPGTVNPKKILSEFIVEHMYTESALTTTAARAAAGTRVPGTRMKPPNHISWWV